jgi:hypothetical protein
VFNAPPREEGAMSIRIRSPSQIGGKGGRGAAVETVMEGGGEGVSDSGLMSAMTVM